MSEKPELMIWRMGPKKGKRDLHLPRPGPALSSCVLWVSFQQSPSSSPFPLGAVIKPESTGGVAQVHPHDPLLELSSDA